MRMLFEVRHRSQPPLLPPAAEIQCGMGQPSVGDMSCEPTSHSNPLVKDHITYIKWSYSHSIYHSYPFICHLYSQQKHIKTFIFRGEFPSFASPSAQRRGFQRCVPHLRAEASGGGSMDFFCQENRPENLQEFSTGFMELMVCKMCVSYQVIRLGGAF